MKETAGIIDPKDLDDDFRMVASKTRVMLTDLTCGRYEADVMQMSTDGRRV